MGVDIADEWQEHNFEAIVLAQISPFEVSCGKFRRTIPQACANDTTWT